MRPWDDPAGVTFPENSSTIVIVTETVEFQDSSPCKRHRFVVTGHGKYEKVPTDGGEDANGQSGKTSSFLCKNTLVKHQLLVKLALIHLSMKRARNHQNR